MHQAEFRRLAYQRPHAVIAQAAGMKSRWHECRSQGVHLDQRRKVSRVAEIISVPALGQGRGSWPVPPR